ncbi:MAG: AtpZ/AtpI family protein [Bacteroidota bacterium]
MKRLDLDQDSLKYLSLGAEIAAGLAIPLWVGYKLDDWLETSPWFLLGGSVAGLVILLGIFLKLSRDEST